MALSSAMLRMISWIVTRGRTQIVFSMSYYSILKRVIRFKCHYVKTNGRGSAVNWVLDGSTYLGQKLVPSSLCQKILLVKKATAYTWDWKRHLVGDGALFTPNFYYVELQLTLRPRSTKSKTKVFGVALYQASCTCHTWLTETFGNIRHICDVYGCKKQDI
jgi:hypothetical protein